MDKFNFIQIKNKNFINFLCRYLITNWNLYSSTPNMFPGSQPVSIERKDLEKLQKYIYYVGVKTDGIRVIVIFIKDKNNKRQTILVNRNLNFYNVTTSEDVEYDENLYDGTIFDGELYYVKDKEYKFIVHDSVLICGTKINKLKFSERLSEIECCISAMLYHKNIFSFEIKKFYLFNDFENFLVEYKNSTYNHDGIIFVPESLPVISGTQYSMFKWKPIQKITFDFLIVTDDDDNFIVKVYNLGKLVEFAKVHFNTPEGNKFITETKKLNNYNNNCIVECDLINNNFNALNIRCDKSHPNSLRTIERTLFNVHENIIIEDFENKSDVTPVKLD